MTNLKFSYQTMLIPPSGRPAQIMDGATAMPEFLKIKKILFCFNLFKSYYEVIEAYA